MTTHIPVLLKEAIELLNIKPNGIYVDCTAGRGGHSQEILKYLKSGKLVCIDTDNDAIEFLKNKFKNDKNVFIVKSNFQNIAKVLEQLNIDKVDGVLMDLGVSSPMFDDIKRGFSYHNEAELDMRMDQTQELDAKYIVNNYSAGQMINIFKKYGEINFPNIVVKKIIDFRKTKPLNTTKELVEIIKSSISKKDLFKQKHPAKQYFQALRIEVNDELNVLDKSIDTIGKLLNKNGVLAIITFHSLEDKIVKHKFNVLSIDTTPIEIPINKKPEFDLANKKPISASNSELENNNRSRSAKLRGIIKT